MKSGVNHGKNFLILTMIAFLLSGMVSMDRGQAKPAVSLTILSHRALSNREKDAYADDVFGLNIAAKMKLTNLSQHVIYYRAYRITSCIEPSCNLFSRECGENNWVASSPVRARRVGPPGSEIMNDDEYCYLGMQPGTSIEFEIYDGLVRHKDLRYSLYIKQGKEGEIEEIYSGNFIPGRSD